MNLVELVRKLSELLISDSIYLIFTFTAIDILIDIDILIVQIVLVRSSLLALVGEIIRSLGCLKRPEIRGSNSHFNSNSH